MRNIPLKDIQTGMVLASNVYNIAGQVLLPKGTQLTDTHLQMLKRREVAILEVEDAKEAVKTAEAPPPPSLPSPTTSRAILSPEQVQEKLKYRFHHTDLTHPCMQTIYQEALKYYLKKESFLQEAPHES